MTPRTIAAERAAEPPASPSRPMGAAIRSEHVTARVRIGLAFAAACTAAAAVYPLVRVAQWLLFDEANPALVIYSEHAPYFWRAWTSAYVGVMAGFTAWLVRRPHRLARALAHAVLLAAAMLAAQAVFVP